MTRTAHINIGSNLGDSRAVIERAIGMLSRRLGSPTAVSRAVETPPWGFDSDNMFVNVGVSFATALSPETLLETILDVEREISPASHRDETGGYVDRLIDIDLIAVDSLVVDTPRLTLPHPRLHLRRFVLLPLAETAPQWRHPLTGLTAADMLKRLGS